MEKFKWGFYSFLAGSLIGFIIYAGSTAGSYHNATAVKINDKQYIFKNGTVTYIVNSNEDGSLIMHRGNVGSIKSEDGSVCQSVNFSCGQPVDFNSELYISEKEPETSKYDHKCEECFENIEK